MADLVTVVNSLFVKKNQWKDLSDTDKENAFFMINRNMAKKFPAQSQFFNKKGINRAMSMDVWFLQMKNQVSLPFWFWAGKKIPKKDANLKDLDLYLHRIKIKYNFSDDELVTAKQLHKDWLDEEIEYLKHIDKANETGSNKRRK